jgi:hypothetical protein
MRFVPFLLMVLATLSAASPGLSAQLQPSPILHDAHFAWDEGRYLESMEGYLAVLQGEDGEEYVEEIALLTGELHPVRAVDDDGQSIAVSPDGTHILWSRQFDGRWVTRVEHVDGSGRVELEGAPAVISATGKVAYLDRENVEVRVRDLATGADGPLVLEGLFPVAFTFDRDAGDLFVTAGRDGAGDRLHIVHVPATVVDAAARGGITDATDGPTVLALGAGHASAPIPAAGGRFLVFSRPEGSPIEPPDGVEPTQTPDPGIGVLDRATGVVAHLAGGSPSVSADGRMLAFLRRGEEGGSHRIMGLPLTAGAVPEAGVPDLLVLLESAALPANPAVSPDGDRVAYETQPFGSREIFVVPADGSGEELRVTREVQHDRFPSWVSNRKLIAMKGEFRHRRAYLYDLDEREGYRVSHNNTLRTIAPEYEWAPHPEGHGVLLVAERDGDTIDPRRAVWWVDLTRTISRDDLVERLRANLEEEGDLLERGRIAFAPVEEDVRSVTAEVSVPRIYSYASTLYSFGSKYFTEPGNQLAIAYLTETLESWGYEVDVQWWEPRGFRTANVVATLPGTRNPELVYVISSHFDSVLGSPGADDNSSGTTALLEAARVLKDHPRSATIQFAFLSAEEAGLLGAREFVRLAMEEGKTIAGVLNNDMIGWTRSHRLDNTIRYSNPGIKDIQHAAAHYFSDLITYDALYYRGTDAGVFFETYGDIVGGIGSYPVLGNPNYHQPTDELNTVNQQLVAEVSRTTVASIMLLADSPARLEGIAVAPLDAGGARVT